MRLRKTGGYIDHSETFDEFLAKDGLLADVEEAALKAIAADRGRCEAASVSGRVG